MKLTSRSQTAGLALDGYAPEKPTLPARKGRDSLSVRLRRAVTRIVFPFRTHIPANGVTPREAVTAFLGTMATTAARTTPIWRKLLESGLDDCGLSYDARYAFFETYPVEDYYFAGVVALETAKIRHLYPPAEANELLGEIGDQVDRAAARGDRVISELVFDIIGRIDISQGPNQQKMPYDTVTKAILRSLDIHRNETTKPLMTDKGFRHALGEPLALGMQNWWQAFQTRFVVYLPPEDDSEPEATVAPAPVRARRKRVPTRKVEFF